MCVFSDDNISDVILFVCPFVSISASSFSLCSSGVAYIFVSPSNPHHNVIEGIIAVLQIVFLILIIIFRFYIAPFQQYHCSWRCTVSL